MMINCPTRIYRLLLRRNAIDEDCTAEKKMISCPLLPMAPLERMEMRSRYISPNDSSLWFLCEDENANENADKIIHDASPITLPVGPRYEDENADANIPLYER
jgi:hypothetical protein